RDALAVEQELGAVVQALRALREPALGEALVDERSVVDALVEGVADDEQLGAAQELFAHLGHDPPVDDDVACARAALSGGAEGGPQRALDGQLEIGVGQDHQGVFATELERRNLQIASAYLTDAASHRRGAGEGNLVDGARIYFVDQRFSRAAGTAAVHHAEHTGWKAGPLPQIREQRRHSRRVVGGLPYDGVAAQKRGDQLPARHGDGEVPRGDDAYHADRTAVGEQLLVGQLARHGLPVQAAPFAQEKFGRIDRFLHATARLA